jgi:hypothetical protein
MPHHHDGYVSMNGSVWNCSVCDRPPKDLDRQLADARAYSEAHPWSQYMGPDAEWRQHAKNGA